MKISVIVIFSALLSMASSASYADAYIGLGIGSASYNVDLSGLGGGDFDDNGTGTKIYGGYAFNDYFAAEATYYNFAEASVGAVESSPGSGVFNSANADMKGIGAYVVGMYPVSKEVNLMLKLGVLNWDANLKVNNTSGSNDGTDIAYGVAASYAFTKELLLAAEWESFDTDNPEVSMLSLGFKFIFR
jgi:OOP family OmpA-OmpF porin